MPSTIDADSIRVSGLGDARLLDVVCTSENDSTYDQNDITHALEIKKSIVEAEKRVLDHQANLLVGYGKTLSGEHITPSAMIQFMENFVEQGRKNAVAVSALDEKILDIDRQINEEISKKSLKKGETKRRITVIIAVEESGPVELKLTYSLYIHPAALPLSDIPSSQLLARPRGDRRMNSTQQQRMGSLHHPSPCIIAHVLAKARGKTGQIRP